MVIFVIFALLWVFTHLCILLKIHKYVNLTKSSKSQNHQKSSKSLKWPLRDEQRSICKPGVPATYLQVVVPQTTPLPMLTWVTGNLPTGCSNPDSPCLPLSLPNHRLWVLPESIDRSRSRYGSRWPTSAATQHLTTPTSQSSQHVLQAVSAAWEHRHVKVSPWLKMTYLCSSKRLMGTPAMVSTGALPSLAGVPSSWYWPPWGRFYMVI